MGCPGLLAALKEIYPFQKVQRCIAHRLRNVVVKLKQHQREPVMRECKAIFAAPSKPEAVRRFRRRKRPMQVFPNPESAERIYYGVTDYLNRNWEERPR